MKYFQPTLLSVSIGLLFVATAANTSPVSLNLNTLNSSKITNSAISNSFDFSQQQALANKPTQSRIPSHFDKSLGKATFLWASSDTPPPNLKGIAKEQHVIFSAAHYMSALTGVSNAKGTFETAELVNLHDINKGAIIAKYRQNINGIEVFNREVNVMLDRELKLVASSGYFSRNKADIHDLNLFANLGTAEQAIEAAIKALTNNSINVALTEVKEAGKYQVFDIQNLNGDKVIVDQPRAKKVIFDANDGLKSAYYIEVNLANKDSVNSELFSYVIDSQTNKVLFKNTLSENDNEFTYRVFANQDGYPMEGPHGDVIPKLTEGPDTTVIVDMPLVTISQLSKISTQDPWLTADATTTSGNNVFAYADVIPPQGFNDGDFTAEVTSQNTFDYEFREDQRDNSFANRKSAVVNLFYMNNFLHDFFYDYGFDEAAGNAQLSNYERGGVEGDPLEVQAQDYAGLNNANMLTPADGGSPRMQQFLWNSKDATLGVDFGGTVTSDASIGLLESTQLAGFGAQQYSDIIGNVVRLIDDTAPINDGCERTVNGRDLEGTIAIIDRGACNFTGKVLNAQDAGAIAAIIVNNNDDGTPAPVGGADDAVIIPTIGINFAEGQSIYDLIDNGTAVTVEMFSNFPLKDSSFDNGIVAHEWGHYISNRLIGNANGLNNFQGRNMGEGWGDFHSLMFLALESDLEIADNQEFGLSYPTGTYVENFDTGIRRAPYSTDMTVNPLTFQYIESNSTPPGLPPTNGGSPHAAGELWATSLWEVYVSLINTHGFKTAQDKMASYLIAGYKMTPVSPTFTEARDAILANIIATDEDDFTLALAAFAKRGLGLGAISPDRFSTNNAGVVESFETKLASFTASSFSIDNTFNGVTLGYCSDDGVLDQGETGTVSVTINNAGSELLSGITAKVEVVSDHDVTLENDGVITFADISAFEETTSVPIAITLNTAGTAETLALKVSFPEKFEGDEIQEAAELSLTVLVNLDFEKLPPVSQISTDDMESIALFDNWKENIMRGGELAVDTRSIDTTNTSFFSALNTGVDFGTQTMLISNNGFESDVAYETDTFEIAYGGDFEISFWHFYWLEEGWDGGVIEISLNGGDWIDVTSVGGTFDVGYTSTLQPNNPSQALGSDRITFTGRNGDLSATAGNMEKVNFGTALNGNAARLRFRVGTDSSVSDFGWAIDQVTISNIASPVFSKVIAGDTATCDNALPVVSITGTSSLTESATSALTAVATDRNDDTLSYSWEQTSGPAATLSDADQSVMSFTPPSINSDTDLTFTVTVNDGTDSVSASHIVNVVNENALPTVSVTGTSSLTESATGSLTAVANDEDGGTLSYSWVQTSGPAATLIGAGQSVLSFTPPSINSDTDLTFMITVNDGTDSVSISNTVNVINENILPTVSVTGTSSLTESATGSLTAMATDEDDGTLSYSWVQTSGPAVTLIDANQSVMSFTPRSINSDTDLTFMVTVNDGTDSVSVSNTVRVINENILPTVSVTGTSSLTESATSTLTAVAIDEDGGTLSYSWSQTSGPAATLTGANQSVMSFTPPSINSDTDLTFIVVVNDRTDLVFVSHTVNVINENVLPTVSVTGTSSLTESATGSLTAVANDEDDSTLLYSWEQTSGPAATLSDVNQSMMSFTPPSVNSDTDLIFTVTVNDGTGSVSVSHTVSVVNENILPTVSVIGASGVTESATGSLTAVAIDEDGGTLSYSWEQTSGPAATLSGADQSVMSFTPPSVNSDTDLTFMVTVNDGTGSVSVSQTVRVINESILDKSSGGAMGLLGLFLIPLAFLRRRKNK